jgi:uncharacterized protein YbjT (DUF2867 family)
MRGAILVIGGRSKIGSALIEELVASGEAVRALVRSGESAASFPDGVEAVRGDLSDRDSLRVALQGADRLFLLCGPTEHEVELNRHAIDVASEARVTLLVRSSIVGSDPKSGATFVRDHGLCDAYLRQAGLPYAIVRPNMFMQNIVENTIPSIDGEGNFYTNAGDARISMVDTRDVGAVAAALLTQPGHEGDAYDVTGPQALSYEDVASKLSDMMGRQIRYVDVPDEAVAGALSGFGLGDWLVGGLVELFADYRRSGEDGYAAQVTDTVERLTGRPPRSLDQLLTWASP